MDKTTIATELLGASASVALLAAYQLWLRARVRLDPSRSVHSLNRLARAAWVEAMMGNPANGVLAIQTLRNSVMASTLMASTSVLLIIGALSASADPAKFSALWPHAALVKILALLVALFLSFFFFAMAVRSFNHVGYMITVPPERSLPELSPPQVIAHLERAGFYHFLGLRTFLFCIPLVFWLFGPHLMVAASIGLVFALYRLDRAPPPPPADAPS